MNLRVKTYVFILVLSLIVMLIAGMYLVLIRDAIDFSHPQVNTTSNQTLSGFNQNNAANFYGMPEELFSLFMKDPVTPGSSYPPPLADKETYPYPAAVYPTP